ncbi:hypothetical protein WOSG25_011400 [Weissella oryzae SG25]|uniref:DUF4097 domain-containing protein n=1 Tax=Weissella oryzae (strain DSM 25784 / JCM 18191 / LMG 30913 / SG25) TaxID=1329250 RepID=A0A069CQS6_WEIOS|nr:DUF4097 family beta strand repeat-containing protein [Weissella oryzae]GAK30050.1 hypothetical protein WOSG25_011400 [Weissella oryzae SG25]
MNEIIQTALAPIFEGVSQNSEVADFYRELTSDLAESAQNIRAAEPNLTKAEAVNRALDGMGDLRAVALMIAETNSADKQLPISDEAIIDWAKKGQKQVFRAIPVDRVQNVIINALDADVRIVASHTDDLEVDYYQRGINGQAVQIDENDGNIRIILPRPSFMDYVIPFRHPRQFLEVRLPEDILGTLRLDARAGRVVLDNFKTADLDIAVILTAGSLRIEQVTVNRFDLGTKAGNIRANRVKADEWRVVARAGNIRLVDVEGDFDVAVRSGNVILDAAIGHGIFKATSGNIRTNWRQVIGDLNFAAESGTVKARVPLSDQFKFNLQSQSGIVRLKRDAHYEVQVQGYAKGQTLGTAEYNIVARVTSGVVKVD